MENRGKVEITAGTKARIMTKHAFVKIETKHSTLYFRTKKPHGTDFAVQTYH